MMKHRSPNPRHPLLLSPTNDSEYLRITPIPETDLASIREPSLSNELKQNQRQINKLYSALSELKSGYTILQNENDRLTEKIVALVEENNFLQDREGIV